MQLTKNFSLVEFIDPAIYKEFGDKSIRFLDSRIPLIAQEVKDILSSHYGKNVRVTINGNLNGHTYTESGLRQINTTTGSKTSDHKYGRAIDIKGSFDDGSIIPIKDIYFIITKTDNLSKLMKIGLTTIEDINFTATWLHLSTRYTLSKGLNIVQP
tara:strand:+ start:322 stop:789 length:468 start_codon:yes stop_codon:yes gene_type:complete